MATNGIISIVDQNNQVIIKCVAGCDGNRAKETAKAIKEANSYDPYTIYDICLENGFGCSDCLVVQSTNNVICLDNPDELGELYNAKFNDPNFNPRIESGFASNIEIIKTNEL